jgi:hypothetical protein
MSISKIHADKLAAYQLAEPKLSGNLHERMKFLSKVAAEAYSKHSEVLNKCPLLEQMRCAVFDLEREVALNDCDSKSRAAGKRREHIVRC